MIRNYLIVALRNIWRNKVFTLINVTGLTLGLAIFLIIWIIIRYELSYDDFHKNRKEIFLLKQTIDIGDSEYTTDRSGAMLASALESHFPEIQKTVRLSQPQELPVSILTGNEDSSLILQKFIERNILAVDSTFFEVFTFPLIAGSPESVLDEPNSIVLSQRSAEKYFGSKDPMNEVITIGANHQFRVTGITKDPPTNSTIQFNFIIPFGFLENLGHDLNIYDGNRYFSYIVLKENADYRSLNIKIPDLLNSLYTSELNPVQFLFPLNRVYLYGEERQIIGVYLYTILGVVILLIAIINFINLSTARSLSRSREIAIRKVSGARRIQLIFQFLGESLLISFITMNLALFIVEHTLPLLNRNFNTHLYLQLQDVRFILHIILITIITGILAGIYPAFLLSSFKPVTILRSKLLEGLNPKGGGSRKILVVVQYVFSVVFIVFTIVIGRQFNHLANSDPGFRRDDILYFNLHGDAVDKYQEIKNDLLKLPVIHSVTTTSEIPSWITWGEVEWGDAERRINDIARILVCGYDFTEAFDIHMENGRFYSPDLASDTINGMVVNEEIVRTMGWDDPIDKEFYLYDDKYFVIGVIKDINIFPFNIGGTGLILPFGKISNIVYVRLNEGWSNQDVAAVQSVFEQHVTTYPFEYVFLKDYKYEILQNADNSKIIFIFFGFMGMFVSCLGLLGLVYFVADKRRKEICIRKAFGSSMIKIMFLFSGQFTRLVSVGILIALPLSYLILYLLLQFFTTRTQLSLWIFIVVAVLTMFVSLLTIVAQTIRIAGANPADHLRYE